MIVQNLLAVGDTYGEPVVSLSALPISLFVFNNPIRIIILKKNPGGGQDWEPMPEQVIAPGSCQITGAVGFKIKNASVGNNAVISYAIPEFQKDSPDPSIAGFTPTTVQVSPSGQISALTAIFDTTLLAATGTVTIPNIPGSFAELDLICLIRSTAAPAINDVLLRLNGDSGANYAHEFLQGAGGVVNSAARLAQTSHLIEGAAPGAATAGNNFGTCRTLIAGYASAVAFKSLRSESSVVDSGATQSNARFCFGSWFNLAAITQIALSLPAGSFDIGSRFTLYGR